MEVLTGTPKYEEPIEEPEVTRYRYDGSHQLIAIEHADGARSEYEYDALGRGWRSITRRRAARDRRRCSCGTATG
nr:RHS repeat domain-containing protein [Burkholderia lata]